MFAASPPDLTSAGGFGLVSRPEDAPDPMGQAHRVGRFTAHPAVRAAIRRLLIAIPLLFFVSAISFVLVSLTPGDAARQILGTQASPQAYQTLRRELGLNLPLYEQYWHWLKNALHGDLGTSIITGQSVTAAINARLPVTLSLIIGAILISVLVGLPLGLISAIRGGVLGKVVDVGALIGFGIPAFWLGVELISIFAVKLGWLPATGYVPVSQSISGWLTSLVLPVIALATAGIAAIAKQTREAMLDVLGSEHIRVARANGLSPRSIYLRHGLKNAAPRVLTVLGIQAVGLLGGTVFIENVFALPGMGSLAVTAVTQHDLPVVEGLAVYFTLIVVVVNLAIDLAYTWLNPRVRTS